MHRLIVTSATYRQSSNVTPELLARDPDNRLLARGPRFRVDAEIGARHRARGERPAESRRLAARASIPPAPAFLFLPPASYGPKTWNEDAGPGSLPPRPLHVPLPLRALSDAADVRRAERRLLLRPPRALEHSAAGADHAERAAVPGGRAGAGAADAEGRRQRTMRSG